MDSDDVLHAALEGLTQAVTLWSAERDSGGTAVDMRLDYLNAAARAAQPGSATAIGRRGSELWPQLLDPGTLAICMRVLNTGVPASGQLWSDRPDAYRPGGYTFHASRLDTDTLLWEMRDTGTDLRRAHLLADITAALAVTERADQVVDTLITHGVIAVGAAAGAVAVPDAGGRRHVVASSHNTEGVAPRRFAFDIASPFPMAHAARTGEPLFFRTAADRARAFPQAEPLMGRQWASTAVLPLSVDDRLRGAVSFHFAEPQEFDPSERAFLATLAGQCAQALERARLRGASEQAYGQLSVLAAFSDRVVAATEDAVVFDALLAAVVPRLADGAFVHLGRGEEDPHLAAITHRDDRQLGAFRDLLARYPAAVRAPAGVGHSLRTGRPEVVTDVPAMLDVLARNDGHRAALAALPITSWLIAPLQDVGERIGVLTLVRGGDEPFTARDIPFAAELARRCTAAVRHAQAYRSQEEVARVLQQSLLPRELPTVGGLDLAGCYHSGTRGLQAGGDFYDVFPAAGATTAATIGDVCGTGAAAAARTALVRHSSRAFGRMLTDPAQVTAAVNEALCEETLKGAFCSLAYATFRPEPGAVRMRLTLAGHPYPMIRRADGSVERAGIAGTVLGVVPVPRHTVTEHLLTAGDTVVFYTDGATERRRGPVFLGEDRLAELIARAPGDSAAALVKQVETAILAFSDAPPTDDLAVLAVRLS